MRERWTHIRRSRGSRYWSCASSTWRPRLVGAGAGGEDVEDQLGPVHDPDLAERFEVPALGGRELVVEDDQIGFAAAHQVGQLPRLAAAKVVARVRHPEPLHEPAHHDAAGSVGEPAQLVELFGGLALARSSVDRARENDPLQGCAGIQQLRGYGASSPDGEWEGGESRSPDSAL